jgi:subtilase family protein
MKTRRLTPARATRRVPAALAARIGWRAAVLAAGLAAAAPVSPLAAAPAPAQATATAQAPAAPPAQPPTERAACPPAPARHMRCLVEFRTRAAASRLAGPAAALATASPSGWGAKAIEAAYKLPVRRGTGQTVALVDAFNTPGLAGYLNVYRKQYGLPPCRLAGGCLRMVNQAGHATPLPRSSVNTGWDLETTLDVDMVSAACPHCKILVVEANSPADSALAAAENTAARLGAQVISNSYGSRETGFAMSLARAYHHPGHTIVVSSGDEGFTAADFPANLATVTAVGGTELARATGKRGWRETTWNQDGGSGSGCSAYVAKPAWQHGRSCRMRTTADVSALAWNVAVYEKHFGGWVTVGGTSAAAPLIAGVYALAGNATTVRAGAEYRHPGSLFDVTSGNNNVLGTGGGAVCGNSYLCVAGKGYDAPTGLGTPNGTGAF